MGLSVGVIKRAIQECYKSKFYPYRIGAVVFKNSAILGSGRNATRHIRLPSKWKKHINSLHAEQFAIYSVKNKEKLHGASILVMRITRSDKLSMAFPCQKCLDYIRHVGITNIYYSNEIGEIKHIKLNKI